MSDEELDKLFKSAVENSTAEHDMSDWKNMASRLDHAKRNSGYRKRVVPAVLLGVIMLGVSTFWFVNDLTRNKYNPASIGKIETSIAPIKRPEPAGKTQHSTQILDSEKMGEKNDLSSVKEKVPVNEMPSKIRDNRDQPNLKSEPLSSIAITDTNEGIQKLSVQHSTPVVSASEMDSIVSVEIEAENEEALIDSLRSENQEKNNLERKRGFSIKASIAPDFSSTELFKQGKPGFNLGVVGGYNFSERWSLFTGVILAKKIYTSSNVDDSYSSNGYSYQIDQLDGDCRILDIPFNVYYSFNENRSLSFKAGLGFSSYIMLSEDYTFVVDKPYGSTEYYQRVEHENNEWFKMMNLSVVVQKRLNNQLYLEVEPFVKIPMAGIGAGDISLYSVGGYVSLRFDFYRYAKK